MKISLIAALAENRVIGINDTLPWYLPKDLEHFKHLTTGKAIIMGHKTYKSIGRPLPNRINIVISRNIDLRIKGVTTVSSLVSAIRLAEALSSELEMMVIGGASIYEIALPRATHLYLTHVHAEVEGDTYFPEVDMTQWVEISREDHKGDAANPQGYSFVKYSKCKDSSW